MIVKGTHHTLHWIFGLFVAYLLITRLFISWVQFFPNQFVATSEWFTNSTIQLESVKIDQDWLGFQADLQNLSVESSDYQLQAQHIKIDINLFSLLLPSSGYGDFLEIYKGAFESKVKAKTNTSDINQNLNLEDIGKIDTNISRLWTRVKLQDFVLTEVTRPGLSIHFHDFQSLNGARLSIASEFSLKYKDVLNYERFNLKSSFTPNIWGGIANGEFSLSSFRPLSIKRLSKLLSVNWQSVLPDGELILDLKGTVAQSQIASMTLNLNTQALKWHQTHKGLPESLGLKLVWDVEHQNISKNLKDWRFTLSNIQIDNRYIDSVSAMQLKLEGHDYIRFNADYFDISPFKVIVKSLIKTPHIATLFDRSAYLTISKLNGKLNWKTLELPEVGIEFDRLDLPVTDYPGMSLRQLKIAKTGDKIEVSTPKTVWVMDPKVHKTPMQITLPKHFALTFDQKSQAWSLPKTKIIVDQMPIHLAVKQINAKAIDTQFSISVPSMTKLKDYLPYGFMSPKLKKWLSDGLLAGSDIELKGQIKGDYDNFPFKNGNGVFKMDGLVKNASLKFNAKWPTLTHFDANLAFNPYKLDIAVNKLTLGANLTAKDVLVEIHDLDKKDIALTVKGQVSDKLNKMVKYLQISPIATKTGLKEFLDDGGDFTGNATVNLQKIWVPISGYDKKSETVQGNVIFKKSSLTILKKLELTGIKGQLNFSEKAVSAKKISFALLGGKGQIGLSTDNKTKQVKITGKGSFLEKDRTWFSDAIPWVSTVTVPFKTAKKKDINIDLVLDLAKAGSKLPEPLSQTQLNNKKATVHTSIADGSIYSDLNLPGLVKAHLSWKKFKDGYALNNNKVWLGNIQVAKKEYTNPLSYVKGKIKRLDLDKWIPLSKKIPLFSSDNNQHSLTWAKSDVYVQDIGFLSHDYNNFRFSWATKHNKPLNIELHNKDINGNVILTSKDLINVNVKKFTFYSDEIDKASNKSTSPIKAPEQCSVSDSSSLLPTIDFKGTNLILNDRKLDTISFKLVDTKKNMLIQNIEGAFGAGAGVLNGQYQFNKTEDKSVLNAELTSKNVTAVTDFIKLNKGFTGKSGKVDLQLLWNGGLSCFSTEEATGNIKFVLKDGSVEDVEPGFARLIGLLSVESLVRRLQLDLKDVTNKGMVYDEIKGEADLSHNIITIKNFNIKAPSASGSIKGKADIKTQTFDLNAKITPKVGATLPTIAALAGAANPLTALAVYTVMKVLPGVNENLVTYNYKITGPWSSPIIDGDNDKKKNDQIKEDSILDY
ncbi:hypothetical protein JCM30760_19210 [Thiomicrorhabdus hydrogeniphila]